MLAYSGGLDTSVILKWLQDVYDCEVVTFTADIGQGEELEPAREKAQQVRRKKQIFIEDLREEFVRDFVFPMFRANAVYEGEYLLGTSIARPLIAKRLVEIAQQDRRRRDLARRHRQGQRPGALRARRLCADARREGHRAVARVGPASREKLLALRRASTASRSTTRRRKAARRTRWTPTCCTSRYEGGILEDPELRARRIDVAHHGVAGEGAGQAGIRRARIRARRHRRRQRQEADARARCWRS